MNEFVTQKITHSSLCATRKYIAARILRNMKRIMLQVVWDRGFE
jgi:hypothetical protein